MSKLNRIEISGFKSISPEHPLSLDLHDVTVILGANGSGKSNIISFFKMLNFMMSGSFQKYVETNGGSQGFLFYGSRYTQAIHATLSFRDGQNNLDEYRVGLSYAQGDHLVITSEQTTVQYADRPVPSVKNLPVNFKESVLAGRTDNATLRVLRKILANCKVYQFHDSSMTAPMRNASYLEIDNYLQSEADNLAAFLFRIKRQYPNDYDRIVSYIRLVVPQFKDFVLEPGANDKILLKWKDDSASDYLFLPHQFSDGSMRFIALATLLLQPRKLMPRMIIIDEPELGLHPYAITQLAEMIKDASHNAQIIVATQSPLLVDEFEVSDIVVVESHKESDKNYTTANHLNQDALSKWLEDYSVSELWEKNVIGGRPL